MRRIERLSTGLLPVETNDILCYETKVEGGRKRLRQRDARHLALRRTRRYFGTQCHGNLGGFGVKRCGVGLIGGDNTTSRQDIYCVLHSEFEPQDRPLQLCMEQSKETDSHS